MLDLVSAKAMAKTVDERYQSMHEFASDLNEVKRLLLARLPDGKVVASQYPHPTNRFRSMRLASAAIRKKMNPSMKQNH